MQRYFISAEQIQQNQIQLIGDDVHHIKNVMRGHIGEQFICCDGQGMDYLVEIEKIDSREIWCHILKTSPSQGEPKTQVTLAQALPKGDKLEWILQKGTEIGTVRFLPFISDRTVVKIDARKIDKKRERWERIVKEAAEQAHRGAVPEINSPLTWKQLLQEISRAETAWIAYEKGGAPLSKCLKKTTSDHILLIIGPEGGFSEEEIQEAQDAGATPITLGTRILRTETAPLVALTSILFARQDLGGDL